MGYRNYFYLIDKSLVDRVKDMTYEEIKSYYTEIDGKDFDEEDYISLWDIFPSMDNREAIHEFGKLYWCDTHKRIASKSVVLFTNPETYKHFDDEVPLICGKEGMIEAIECYRQKILNNLAEDEKKTNEELGAEIREGFRMKHIDFTSGLKLEGDVLTDSWRYEYSIFNMIYQLRMIDWDNKVLLFVGY